MEYNAKYVGLCFDGVEFKGVDESVLSSEKPIRGAFVIATECGGQKIEFPIPTTSDEVYSMQEALNNAGEFFNVFNWFSVKKDKIVAAYFIHYKDEEI